MPDNSGQVQLNCSRCYRSFWVGYERMRSQAFIRKCYDCFKKGHGYVYESPSLPGSKLHEADNPGQIQSRLL